MGGGHSDIDIIQLFKGRRRIIIWEMIPRRLAAIGRMKPMSTTAQQTQQKWDEIVGQIQSILGTESALIDKYGVILASKIPGIAPGSLFSPPVWEIFQSREKLEKGLGSTPIHTAVFGTEMINYVLAYGDRLFLMTLVPHTVDLSKFLPSIKSLLNSIEKSTAKKAPEQWVPLSLDDEFGKLLHEGEGIITQEKFPIFKHLIKYIAQK